MEQQNQQPNQEKIETKPPVKTDWKFLAIGAFVAVVVSVGGILLLKTIQPVPVAPTPPSPSPSEATHWKTYRNSAYNFSVEYPADWAIDYYPSAYPLESADTVLFDKFTERTLVLTEQVTVGIYADHNEDGLSLKEFILKGGISIDYPLIVDFINREAELEHRKERVQEMKETTFRGFEALQDGENRLFINTGSTVFSFYIHSLEDISTEDREIFNQILSSFRLTDTVDTSDWQTYRNAEYGFEIKYPPDWLITSFESVPPADIYGWTTMSIFSPDREVEVFISRGIPYEHVAPGGITASRTPQATIENKRKDFAGYSLKEEHASIGNRAAVKFKFTYSDSYAFIDVYIPLDDTILLQITQRAKSQKGESYESIFDQILSTFRFID